jgi:hypothetical protein
MSLLLLPWTLTKWLGRVCLWLAFWPVGLWRSIRHGKDKRHKELVKELRRSR